MATTTLTLFCLISGDTRLRAFKVKNLDSFADVDDLKTTIVEEDSDIFKNVKARELVLWLAKIPIEEKGIVTLDGLDDKTILDPRTRLSELFPESPDESTFIVIERPKGLKRPVDDDNDFQAQKHWKPNATVYKGLRPYVYYSDQTENNQPLVDLITRGRFLRLHGPRASGKSSRMVDAMTELRKSGLECIEITLEYVKVSSEEKFWLSFGKAMKKFGYSTPIHSDTDFLEVFTPNSSEPLRRNVVIIIDEFDKLLDENAEDACSSFLQIMRGIRNSADSKILSVVCIGTAAILELNQAVRNLSPFNVSDNFRNGGLTMKQMKELFTEFAQDHELSIDDEVIEDMFVKTDGHAGLVNVCGLAIENYLQLHPDCEGIQMDLWGSVQNRLLASMGSYATFDRLLKDLGKSTDAVSLYRDRFLGKRSDEQVLVIDKVENAKFLVALGILKAAQDGYFTIASPIMDSFVRQKVIPMAFPHAPTTTIPWKPGRLLDILRVIKEALPFFDRSFMADVFRWSYKVARQIMVRGSLNTMVPRKSVYEGELLRILSTWFSAETSVTNQYHIMGVGRSHYFCDMFLDPRENPIPVELMANGTTAEFKDHVNKIILYKKVLGANEAWLINFTMEDNYSQHAKWPTEEELRGGHSVVHVCHNRDFSKVQLLAKFNSSSGEIVEEQAEMLNGVWN